MAPTIPIPGDDEPASEPKRLNGATDSGGFLTREAILAAPDVQYDTVDVPEWGGPVRVRSLTARERDAYDAESARMSVQPDGSRDQSAALVDFRTRRVARAIVDGDGNPIFSATDIRALGEKNGAVIDRIDDVVVRLSGMDADAPKRALDALKGGPSEGSGTA